MTFISNHNATNNESIYPHILILTPFNHGQYNLTKTGSNHIFYPIRIQRAKGKGHAQFD
jgi:hypothetical protein